MQPSLSDLSPGALVAVVGRYERMGNDWYKVWPTLVDADVALAFIDISDVKRPVEGTPLLFIGVDWFSRAAACHLLFFHDGRVMRTWHTYDDAAFNEMFRLVSVMA